MKRLRILLCSDNLLYAQTLAAVFENISSFDVIIGDLRADNIIFDASVLQPDIVVWKLNEHQKCLSRLKELRFCCPSSQLFLLADNPANMDISTMFDLKLTASLPALLPAVQIANAVELSIDAGLICLPL